MGNFFNNLSAKIDAFMIGRNGSDKLSFTCLVAAVVIVVINAFLSSVVLALITWALLIYSLFRCFSTNVPARRAENEKFESFFARLRNGKDSGGRGTGNGGSSARASSGRPSRQAYNGGQGSARAAGRARQSNSEADTITFQCEQCGQKLSVPKGKGTLKVTCPKCHHQQKVNS